METLGKGSFGRVQRAFLKPEGEYVALKFYEENENNTKEEALSDIEDEDYLLKNLERIRENNKDLFLKYYGIFKNPNPANGEASIILQMQSGNISLQDLLNAGKKFPISNIFSIMRNLDFYSCKKISLPLATSNL